MLFTSDTKNKIKDRMVDIISLVEQTECVQIAVNSYFFNRFADLICNSLFGYPKATNTATFSDFYENLLNELNKFRKNKGSGNDIITKINFFAD